MNHLLDRELDNETDQAEVNPEREISLGAGTILGIFFGLALLCGAVFGLGYSMGRHSAQNAPAAEIVGEAQPAPMSAATKPAAGYSAPAPVQTEPSAPEPDPAPEPAGATSTHESTPVEKVAAKETAVAPGAGAPGGFMVQVAAVSTQEIADIELAALKKYNYRVVVRHEPQDQLLHIQIGPFGTKKDAEAMRQDVLSHGFNAIVK